MAGLLDDIGRDRGGNEVNLRQHLLVLLRLLVLLLLRLSLLLAGSSASLCLSCGFLRCLSFLLLLGGVEKLLAAVGEPLGILDVVLLLQLGLLLLVLLLGGLVNLPPLGAALLGDLRDPNLPEGLLGGFSALSPHPEEVGGHGPLGHTLDL